MSSLGYQQGPLTPEIQKRIASSELLRKAELHRQGVAPSVNQQPLSSTPSTSEPAPSTTAVSLHDTPDSPHSEHGPGARDGGDPSGQQRRSSEETIRDVRSRGGVTIPGQEGYSFTFEVNDDNTVNVETHNPDGSSSMSRQSSFAGALGQKGFNLDDVEREMEAADIAGVEQDEREEDPPEEFEEDDEPKWMSYPDGPLQQRVAEREGAANFGPGVEDGEEGARVAEAQRTRAANARRRDLGERGRMA